MNQLQLAVDTAKLGVWRLDPGTQRMDWNDQLLRIYGLRREEFDRSQQHHSAACAAPERDRNCHRRFRDGLFVAQLLKIVAD
ncbi:hypothetical protein CKO36_12125 [Rhabdochromatium marinum]|nr:hypothetical protein [Rhabdochromatium marinum]